MAIEIPITERSRKYGYIFWDKQQDEKVEKFLGKSSKIGVWLDNSYLGKKNVDWKYRRISLGWSKTREFDYSVSFFKLSIDKDGAVRVNCK